MADDWSDEDPSSPTFSGRSYEIVATEDGKYFWRLRSRVDLSFYDTKDAAFAAIGEKQWVVTERQ